MMLKGFFLHVLNALLPMAVSSYPLSIAQENRTYLLLLLQRSYWVSFLMVCTESYLILCIFAIFKVLNIIPGTHDWDQYVTPDEMINILEGSLSMDVLSMKGLIPHVEIEQLIFRPCVHSALKNWKLSDTDLDVNYILHSVKKIT
jgi:sorbitol-specific phosphotransferase system component IIC